MATDIELIEQIQKGKRKAYEQLFRILARGFLGMETLITSLHHHGSDYFKAPSL